MIIFPVQLDGFRISKIGDRTLTLHTYEQYAGEVSKLTDKPMGTEYIAIFIPSDAKEEIDEFKSETPEETKERFRKRFNALIGELATIRKTSAEKLREEFKIGWIKSGVIKKSTTELDIAGYAARINELVKLIHDAKMLQDNKI